MTTPRRTDRVYTNPTNPYYDPLWSQSYADRREPIREEEHRDYYRPGYDYNRGAPYYGEGGYGYYDEGMMGGYGGMMGGGGYDGRGMYAVPPSTTSEPSGGGRMQKTMMMQKKGVMNGNSLMRANTYKPFQVGTTTALSMAYFDGPMWDGPPLDPMMPPPGYGRGMRPAGGVMIGTGGAYGANQMSPNYYRRNSNSGFRRGRMGPVGGMGPMGVDPFVRPGQSFGRAPGPFGRDKHMSLGIQR